MKLKAAKIWVVEDDLAMQSLLREFLELQGHQVVAFRLADQALDELRRQAQNGGVEVDLIISDINMPQMNGIEFLSTVRGLMKKPPMIMITAFGNERTQANARVAGAAGFLNKPFKLSDLKEVVASVLEHVA